ncbi:MAG: hypothetical protein KA236_14395 [Verrucomicrobia bacterium]|jgi:hypothetical protein|nr:hypothetical protein [Verrucomicrobiota bacterium]
MNAYANGSRGFWSVLVAGLGACLIFVLLILATRRLVQPPPLSEDSVAVRLKALAEVQAADAQALTTAGWLDQPKGIVRLPVETAITLTEREWRHPAQARSNLLARLEKATFVPPPPPEKPSEYE